MIGHADVEKLRSMRAPGPAVLSLYLSVPPDRLGVRGLAPLEDLMARAGAGGQDGARPAKGLITAGAVPVRDGIRMTLHHPRGQPIEHARAVSGVRWGHGGPGRAADTSPGHGRPRGGP